MRSSSHIFPSLVGGLLVTVVACSQPTSDAASGANTADGGDGGEGPGTGDASGGGDTGPDGGPAGGASPATIATVTARAVGRTGSDLLITVEGTDPTQTAYGAHLRVLDASGNKVLAFEGNWNGTTPGTFGANAAERRVLFDPTGIAGQATFARTITLPRFMKSFPSIGKVEVAVLTVGDRHTKKLTAGVTKQSVQGVTQTCDPELITDRCAPGLACADSVCAAAGPPQLAKFAYAPSADGPHMLFEGLDPAGDVSSVLVEFLDAQGDPKTVDMTGDGDFASSQELTFGDASSAGAFFFDNFASHGFDALVPRLAATPISASNGPGARTLATFGPLAMKSAGQECDPRGFSPCSSGHACMPGPTEGSHVCVAMAAAKTSVFTAAPTLDLSKGQTFVTGYARGTSLWDPPPSCVPSGAKTRPEGIVRLRVPAALASLTITTAVEETNFDTIVYLLKGNGSTPGTPVSCNDDAAGSASTLTLTNVQAGDYTIVVDSEPNSGGAFGVKIR